MKINVLKSEALNTINKIAEQLNALKTSVNSAISDVSAAQERNNASFQQLYTNTTASLEQARSEVLKLAAVDPRFISTTTDNPRQPTEDEWNANGGFNGPLLIGSKVTETGSVQLVWYQGSSGYWLNYGTPTFTQANANKIAVDASLFGVKEGASAQTLMNAIAATPDGGMLVCPKVKLIQRETDNMYIVNRNNIVIKGNGLIIEADPSMSDNTGLQFPESQFKAGITLLGCKNIDWYDTTYDGRLDARVPVGGDGSGAGGPRSAWYIGNKCENIRLTNCVGHRAMMDGFIVAPMEYQFLPLDFPNRDNFVFERDVPRKIEFINCVGTYAYRQGISVCGVDGFIIENGNYSYTGMLPDDANGVKKWTLPCAGIDWEAFIPFNWKNLNCIMKGNPLISYNKGAGLLIENGTQGLIVDGGHIYKNAGGIILSPSGTADTTISNLTIEDNCLAPELSERIDVALGGLRFKFINNIIKTNEGVMGINVSSNSFGGLISGNTIIAPEATARDTWNGGILISDNTNGVLEIDDVTKNWTGWDGNHGIYKNYKDRYTLTVTNNTVINASNFGYGAISCENETAIVTNNFVVSSTPFDNSIGLNVNKSLKASGNVSKGYSTNIVKTINDINPDINNFLVLRTAGIEGNVYTSPNFGATVKLVSQHSDFSLYTVNWTIVYDASITARSTQFEIMPPLDYSKQKFMILSSKIAGSPVHAVAYNSSNLVNIEVAQSEFAVVNIEALIEISHK